MSTSKVPQLPPTDDNEASSLRYEVNPAIALNALTDIYRQVQQHQVQLRQLAQSIHQVYAEGPVVSGWLASEASLNAAVNQPNPAVKCATSPNSIPTNIAALVPEAPLGSEPLVEVSPQPHQSLGAVDVALFRHGDANDLMNYLSALESSMLERGAAANSHDIATATTAQSNYSEVDTGNTGGGNPSQYYLCQLDSSGQIQAEQCPPEQVPIISMAIARYRRLNQLITQKQVIETKLQAIVDILGDIQTVLTD